MHKKQHSDDYNFELKTKFQSLMIKLEETLYCTIILIMIFAKRKALIIPLTNL